MSNKQYIYIAEESSVDDTITITPKWKSMGFFEKFVLRIFTPLRKEIEESFTQSIKNLRQENNELKREVDKLSKQLLELSGKVEQNGKKTEALLVDYNTKKANSDSKYKAAIDILYKLNLKFGLNVSAFDRANKLEVLHKLVKYLYNSDKALQKEILTSSQNDEKTLSILADIDNFNMNSKSGLIEYLSNIGTTWEDCVQFPAEPIYTPETMVPFNDVEIENGSPIYVVSLGYQFPNSNSEKPLPSVFRRKINLS